MGLKNVAACVFFFSSGLVHAEKALDLALRDVKAGYHAPVSFGGVSPGESLADGCTNIVRVLTYRSQHPGYGDKVNQNNYGYGFKCRIGDRNPMFFDLGGLENSQRGSTFAAGVGKQIDLVNYEIVRGWWVGYYIGGEAMFITYEWPSRKKQYMGLAPMLHEGAFVRRRSPVDGLSVVVGIERDHLPIGGIKLFKAYGGLELRF